MLDDATLCKDSLLALNKFSCSFAQIKVIKENNSAVRYLIPFQNTYAIVVAVAPVLVTQIMSPLACRLIALVTPLTRICPLIPR